MVATSAAEGRGAAAGRSSVCPLSDGSNIIRRTLANHRNRDPAIDLVERAPGLSGSRRY